MRKFRQKALISVSIVGAFMGQSAAADIAFIGPMSGANTIIGQQIERVAALETDDASSNGVVIDDGCNAALAKSAVTNAVSDGAKIIIGLPCIEALDAAVEQITALASDAIILALGVQVQDITSRDGRANWPVYRVGAAASQEAATIAEHLKLKWRGKNFAIIDDGTLYGRQLAETVRFLIEEDNLKPVFTDTFRPLLERQAGLVRRIAKSGATHVFIGGDAYDAAVIGNDAAALGIDLSLAGGAAFWAPPDDGILPDRTIFTAVPPLSIEMAGEKLTDYAALTAIADDIAKTALQYSSDNDVTIGQALTAIDFNTPIGALRFDINGENTLQWFSVFTVQDGEFSQQDGVN